MLFFLWIEIDLQILEKQKQTFVFREDVSTIQQQSFNKMHLDLFLCLLKICSISLKTLSHGRTFF